ncbi:MAG TPA: alpha/beta fold hydrolase [Tissierellia bacterium]|nr:alpha/beta fold hydrolase [Tissierellia bacterium]
MMVKKSIKKTVKILAMVLVLALITGVAAFFLYVSQYYKVDDHVAAAISNNAAVRYQENYLLIPATGESESALVFYPGAKVEFLAYYPLLNKISQHGITCVVVDMPFHLAFFNSSAIERMVDDFPEVKRWFIGGHSLGGAMASHYASTHQDKISGLILLGAYIYGEYPVEQSITIYGSNDQIINRSKITYKENVYLIDGGNHAQFGNYGEQKGDGIATISREEQQSITVQLIVDFLRQ